MSPTRLPDTAEYALPPTPDEAPSPPVPSQCIKVTLGGLSHPGTVRPNNEDHFLVASFGRWLGAMMTNLPDDFVPRPHEECGYAMLVADGMGGMAAGEVASRSAIGSLFQLVAGTPDWIMTADRRQAEEVMQRMAERFRQIDRLLQRQSRSDPALAGMGTTMTLACTFGLSLILCHIGDSRAYLFRGGRLDQLTRDMTLVQVMLDAGLITTADAAGHRLRHMLTQCLGGGGEVKADVHYLPLEPGDRLLLCTDGLSEMVPDARIADVLAAAAPPQETCQALVDAALAAGGRDNVTVVLADFRVDEPDGGPPAPPAVD
jgi:protein phosphatase